MYYTTRLSYLRAGFTRSVRSLTVPGESPRTIRAGIPDRSCRLNLETFDALQASKLSFSELPVYSLLWE